MAAPNMISKSPSRFPAPPEDAFAAGLRNIRHAIESRLVTLGIHEFTLRDTAGAAGRAAPTMVIVDVKIAVRAARVTFTRDEVEDCAAGVQVHCVQRKIDRALEPLHR